MQKLLIVLFGIIGIVACKEQASNDVVNTNIDKKQIIDKKHRTIFNALRVNDSLLFELGFNKCDTNQIKKLTSNDFEFYHDQAGITNSKEAFIQSIKGLCNLDYRPTRELTKNSLTVHLLKNQGKVYGAIQNGQHKFYGAEKGKPKYLTSTAEFTHLWIIEDDSWKLKRVLSYDHVAANE